MELEEKERDKTNMFFVSWICWRFSDDQSISKAKHNTCGFLVI